MSIQPKLFRKVFILLVYTIVAVRVLTAWLNVGIDQNTNKPGRSFHTIVTGEAPNPYVRRVLVPLVIRGISNMLPSCVDEKIRNFPVGWGHLARGIDRRVLHLDKFIERNPIEREYLSEYLIGLAVVFGTLLALAYALRGLFCVLYENDGWVADIFPAFAMAWLPTTFREANFAIMYDFATPLLFTLGVVMLSSRRWWLFYVVFILGSLHKETFLLMTFLFGLVSYQSLARPTFIRHVAGQLGIFVSIQATLFFIFVGNPGGGLRGTSCSQHEVPTAAYI